MNFTSSGFCYAGLDSESRDRLDSDLRRNDGVKKIMRLLIIGKSITVGRSCFFNSLYWDFFERYRKSLGKNPRLSVMITAATGWIAWERNKS